MEAAVFPMMDLFGDESDSEEDECTSISDKQHIENKHQFPGVAIVIREFDFHVVNANLVWPGTASFAEWLLGNRKLVQGKKVLEIGSGTGILAIFLAKALQCSVTTSDYDDPEIEENIAYNFRRNGLVPPPHLRHTWGTPLEGRNLDWEVLVASDILLYVKEYDNLIRSLRLLLTNGVTTENRRLDTEARQVPLEDAISAVQLQASERVQAGERQAYSTDFKRIPQPYFLMSWRRRIPKEDEAQFFNGCRTAGLYVTDVGPRIYCITSNPWQD